MTEQKSKTSDIRIQFNEEIRNNAKIKVIGIAAAAADTDNFDLGVVTKKSATTPRSKLSVSAAAAAMPSIA